MLAFHPLFARDPLLDHLLAGVARPLCARRVTASASETEHEFEVVVQAPGVKQADFHVSYEHDVLTIEASSTETELSFKRQVKLPNADPITADAKLEDGILTITLKKLPTPENVYIKVNDSHSVGPDEDQDAAKPYTLTLAAPGVKASDILIEASQAHLSIHGETTRGHGCSFTIHRTYKLPRDVDVSAATATHVDGLLSVTLPTKPAEAATSITIHKAATKEEEAEAEAAGSSEGDARPATPVDTAEATPTQEAVEKEEKAAEAKEEAAWLAEWDTLLDDLSEMGFDDRESNRAALTKHSGSIKLAVKELVVSRTAV